MMSAKDRSRDDGIMGGKRKNRGGHEDRPRGNTGNQNKPSKKRLNSDEGTEQVSMSDPANQPVKKSKIANLTLDMFDGDVAAWFEALQEHADPTLSKLERGTLQKEVSFVELPTMWEALKPFAVKKDVPSQSQGPLALVVSSSADRSCIVAKTIRKFPGALGKLFARHIKVAEQKEFLEKNSVGVAVGTPNRLLKLCDDKILKLDHLKVLVVDLQVDSKSFTVLNMPEVSRDFFKFFREYVNNLSQDVKVIIVKPAPVRDSVTKVEVRQDSKPGNASKNTKKENGQRHKKKKRDHDEDDFIIQFKDDLEGKPSGSDVAENEEEKAGNSDIEESE